MNLDIPFDILFVLGQYINDSKIGLAVQDSSDRFQFHNRAFAAMLGLETRSCVGLSSDEMLALARKNGQDSVDWPALRGWLDLSQSEPKPRLFRSFEVLLNDGRWILATQQSHENGMVVTLCTDVSAKKQMELDLRAAHDELERLAMTDELTGVPNRRNFFAQLEREYERASRYGHTVCLAMIDLDHFKRVNDSYGHAAGDEVLKHFAGVVNGLIRGEDLIGRVGGEEFALLLPETTEAGAAAVLERVRDELAGTKLHHIAPDFTYTFSAGVAGVTKSSMPPKDWMRAADEALYAAKSAGRNRVVIHQA